MKINKIFIKDFGVYNDQILNIESPGIVVIAGRNGSGKSTLMEIIRHMGYGFKKGENMPKPKLEMQCDFNLTDDNNRDINIWLKGYSKPVIKYAEDESDNNPFSSIDYFSYKQLFTISLDELNNLEKGKNNELKTVLLAAGLKDLIELPRFIDKFNKETNKIGGKSGSIKTKLFKPYYTKLQEGIDLKRKSENDVERYFQKGERLHELNKEIENLNQDKDLIENKVALYETYKNNYQYYLKLNSFNISFDSKYIEPLLKKNKLIQKYIGYIEVLKLKINNHKELEHTIKEQQDNITRKMMINDMEWELGYENLLKINTDSNMSYNIKLVSEKYEKSIKEEEQCKKELNNLIQNKNILLNKVNKKDKSEKNIFIRYLVIALVSMILGFGVYIFNKPLGLMIGLFGIGCGIIFSLTTLLGKLKNLSSEQNMKMNLDNINISIEQRKKELETVQKEQNEYILQLKKYRNILNLKESTSLGSLVQYYDLLFDLKKEVIQLKSNVDNNTKLKNDIDESLKEMYLTISEFEGLLSINLKENIFEGLAKLKEICAIYKIMKTNLSQAKTEIDLSLVINKLGEFSSEQALIDELNQLNSKKILLIDSINKVTKETIELNQEIKLLYSKQDIMKAYEDINSSRDEIKRLGFQYATYAAAEFILNEVKKNYIKKYKENILQDEIENFNYISGNNYRENIFSEENDLFKYNLIEEKGSKKSDNELSRGLHEQLYLSIRLSRIKEINKKYPVIIDDSFVNFDAFSRAKAIDTLCELSKTHQVFILTCHSEIIETISKNNVKCECFFVEQGNIQKLEKEKIIMKLKNAGLS